MSKDRNNQKTLFRSILFHPLIESLCKPLKSRKVQAQLGISHMLQGDSRRRLGRGSNKEDLTLDAFMCIVYTEYTVYGFDKCKLMRTMQRLCV